MFSFGLVFAYLRIDFQILSGFHSLSWIVNLSNRKEYLIMNESANHGKSKCYSDTIHPPQWESLLKDVTAGRSSNERTLDPQMMDLLYAKDDIIELLDRFVDSNWEDESIRKIELVRKIAIMKLKGLTRYCILLVLMTGAGPQRISEILGNVSLHSVHRLLNKGINIIKKCLADNFGDFPVGKGARPPIRVCLFPLDTPEEKQQFTVFLNEHTVMHVSYRGDDLFREALVIFLTGKASRRSLH